MTGLSNAFVCLMGMGTVFTGLICIVLICKLQTVVLKNILKPEQTKVVAPAKKEEALSPDEKSEVIAGVCACIAEELGTDASNIKVLSFKRV